MVWWWAWTVEQWQARAGRGFRGGFLGHHRVGRGFTSRHDASRGAVAVAVASSGGGVAVASSGGAEVAATSGEECV